MTTDQLNALTPLDAACFIAAIPATVVYNAVRGTTPFPSDDSTTTQLINAADLAAMQAILEPPFRWAQQSAYLVTGWKQVHYLIK
jgi:hypothetical protein